MRRRGDGTPYVRADIADGLLSALKGLLEDKRDVSELDWSDAYAAVAKAEEDA